MTKINFEKLGSFPIRSGADLRLKDPLDHSMTRRYAAELAEKYGYTYAEVPAAYTTIRSHKHAGIEGIKGFILIREMGITKIVSELVEDVQGLDNIPKKFDNERTEQFPRSILDASCPDQLNDPSQPYKRSRDYEIWFWPNPAGNNLHVKVK